MIERRVGVIPEIDLIISYFSIGGNPQYKVNDQDLIYKATQGDTIIFSITPISTPETINYLWRVMQGSQVLASSTEITTFNWTVPSTTSTWQIEIEATIKDELGNTTGRESIDWSITTSDLKTVNPGESIQDAIDSLPSEGGVVELAEGIHHINATIVMKSNVILIGQGTMNNVEINGGSSFTSIQITNSTNVRLQNFTVNNNVATNDNHCLSIKSSSNLYISHIHGTNCRTGLGWGEGLDPDSAVDNITVIDSKFSNAVITMGGTFLSNSLIKRVEVRYSTNWDGIHFNSANDNNIVEDSISHHNFGSGFYSYVACDNNIWRNNIAYENGRSGWTGHQTGNGNIVTNNIFYDNKLNGVTVEYGGPYTATVKVESNTIYSNDGSGIALTDAPGYTILAKNNIVVNNSEYGIKRIAGTLETSYNDVWSNGLGKYNGISAGAGDISADPLFANSAAGDFHLKSHAGRWNGTSWVNDTENSPCLNTGDPTSDNLLSPWGGIIEIGAYGNTPESSNNSICPVLVCDFIII